MIAAPAALDVDGCWTGPVIVDTAAAPAPATEATAEPAPEPITLPEDSGRAAILRGSARGLEIVVDGRAPLAVMEAVLTRRLEQAPAFFRASDVRIRVDDGPLAPGSLARLDEIARTFDLRIVEVGPSRPSTIERAETSRPIAMPEAAPVETATAPVETAPAPVETFT